MNHIATGRALSLGGELLPPHHGDSDGGEDGGGDGGGDDSGGNSPTRQGAGAESSVPRIGLSRWRRLWMVFSVSVKLVEVFRSGTIK